MAKRISDITRFTTYAQTASESELDFMMQVIKAIKDARFTATKPDKPRTKRSDAGRKRVAVPTAATKTDVDDASEHSN